MERAEIPGAGTRLWQLPIKPMPSRVPPLPGSEPLDLRIAGAFLVLVVVLVAPGIARGLSPVDGDGLEDAASTLESQAREALALIERREATTDLAFSAELQDLGGAAEETRSSLLHQAVDPGVTSNRDEIATAAGKLADAAADASVAGHDRMRLDRDRATLQGLIEALHRLVGNS
jgi:hypothetical protein